MPPSPSSANGSGASRVQSTTLVGHGSPDATPRRKGSRTASPERDGSGVSSGRTVWTPATEATRAAFRTLRRLSSTTFLDGHGTSRRRGALEPSGARTPGERSGAARLSPMTSAQSPQEPDSSTELALFTDRWVGRWRGISCAFPGAGHSPGCGGHWRSGARARAPVVRRHGDRHGDPADHHTPATLRGLGERRRHRRRQRHGRGGRPAHRDLVGRAVPRDAAAQLLRPRLVQRRLVHRQRWVDRGRQQHPRLRTGRDAAPPRPVRPGRAWRAGTRSRRRPAAYDVRHLGVVLIGLAGTAAAAGITRILLGSWRWERGHGGGAPGAADVDRPRDVQRQGRAGRHRLHPHDPRPRRDGLAGAGPAAPARRRAGRRHHADGGHPARR